ncbi:T9SS type B sorting domain-containing protein, partial [Flavobacterium rhizosphaerae]
ALSAGDIITSTQMIYIYAQSAENADCYAENTFTVTITPSPVFVPEEVADVTACDSYTLPALTVGGYYDAADGAGNVIPAGTAFTTNQTVYVYAVSPDNPACTTSGQFTVTITTTPTPDAPADIAMCDSYSLPALTVGNYYTGPGGTGNMLTAGSAISESQVLYVYAVSADNADCWAENAFAVTIVPTPEVAITEGCNDENMYELQAAFTDGIYTPDSDAGYVWTDASGTEIGYGPSVVISATGTYMVTVTPVDDAECPSVATIEVLQTTCDVQRGISPNDDGMNDNFDLTSLDVRKLSIFNRYGKEVFSFGNYTNQWHGQSNGGDELPT